MIAPPQTAFVFPGQGSQALGMGRALAEAYPTARQTFQEADELLGFALSKLMWDGPEEALNDTLNTQPALLAHSAAAWRVFQEIFPNFQPAFVAGHSMGQLSALVAAGALPFEAALQLARRRGELMQQAGEENPGRMAAILGLDIPALEQVCAAASAPGEPVQVANDNCPGQVVISGATAAVERAVELAQQAGARRAKILAVSIPAHSVLMAPVQEQFSQAVEAAGLTDPQVPLVGNVSAAPLTSTAELHADLRAQLNARVRWTETIQAMRAAGVENFLELGSGEVLTGLLKRIDRTARGFPLGAPEDFERLQSA